MRNRWLKIKFLYVLSLYGAAYLWAGSTQFCSCVISENVNNDECEFPPRLEEDLSHLRRRRRLTNYEGVVCLEDYPYTVSVRVNREHRCGGAIVSRLWILSAAECFDYVMAAEVSIRVGSVFRDFGGRILSAVRIKTHPLYRMNVRFPQHNLALLKVNVAIRKGLRSTPVRLPTRGMALPTKLDSIVVTGYGSVRSNHVHVSVDQELRHMMVQGVYKSECRLRYGKNYRLQYDHICLESAGRAALCNGDIGDPAVIFNATERSGTLYGIAVFSANAPCFNQTLGVYTKVELSLDWLELVMSDNESEVFNSEELMVKSEEANNYDIKRYSFVKTNSNV